MAIFHTSRNHEQWLWSFFNLLLIGRLFIAAVLFCFGFEQRSPSVAQADLKFLISNDFSISASLHLELQTHVSMPGQQRAETSEMLNFSCNFAFTAH